MNHSGTYDGTIGLNAEQEVPAAEQAAPEAEQQAERKPCPECGKKLTWLADGSRPRAHKCVPKQQAQPAPEQQAAQTQPAQQGAVIVSEVIAKYVETRDRLTQMKKEYEASIEELKALQGRREIWLQSQLKANGIDSMKTEFGTCYTDTVFSTSLADRAAFIKWALEGNRVDAIDVKANKSVIRSMVEDGESPPPGVNVSSFVRVKVRRS